VFVGLKIMVWKNESEEEIANGLLSRALATLPWSSPDPRFVSLY
jgi:hypothetical protein